jgi:hypothetical protein
MKRLLLSIAVGLLIASCTNSPEGDTNTEGTGASILPEKSGDTSRVKKSDAGGGGEYTTDTMPGTAKVKGKDSSIISEADSGTMKIISGKRSANGEQSDTLKKAAKKKQ